MFVTVQKSSGIPLENHWNLWGTGKTSFNRQIINKYIRLPSAARTAVRVRTNYRK